MKERIRDLKVTGIVIRKTEHKETSLILEVFTKNLGSISMIAKGVRKAENKSLGILEILNELDFNLYKNPNSDWYIFKSANFIKSHIYKVNFEKTILMQAAIEIYRQLIISTQDSAEFYELLQKYLNYIKTVKSNGIAIYWRFLLKLFKILGIQFNLKKCVICKNENELLAYFSQKHGFICEKCYKPAYEEFVFLFLENEGEIFSKLNQIGNHLDKINLSKAMILQINKIFLTHISEHFHKKFYLNSLEMY